MKPVLRRILTTGLSPKQATRRGIRSSAAMLVLASASAAFAGTAGPVTGAAVAPEVPTTPVKGLHVTLRSDFTIDCVRIAPVAEKSRLYLDASGDNYIDVASRDVLSAEVIDLPTAKPEVALPRSAFANPEPQLLPSGSSDIPSLITVAGDQFHIDRDLIAAIVKQESNSNPRALSRVGARGLMQLMPGTASLVGVHDAFDPSENVQGGTAYFNSLLIRYHDDPYLALAAYNAGPGAVDKYHGIPPYRETRAYVARIIHDFNRRKTALLHDVPAPHAGTLAAGMLR